MKILMLAGGKGTRLAPLTHHHPKVLASVHGKPILHWLLKLYAEHEVILSLGYMSDTVIAWCAENNVNVKCVVEDHPLGTAGAVLYASDYLIGDRTFCVVNGDTWHDISLTAGRNVFAARVYAQNLLTEQMDCAGIYMLDRQCLKHLRMGKSIDDSLDSLLALSCHYDSHYLDMGSHDGLRYAKTSSLF
jgi:NDP-sugar pyrophosphorylase family protein